MVLSKPLQVDVELPPEDAELPPEDAELPPEDERLVAPETPYEMVDGELVYVAPSDYEHGDREARGGGLVVARSRARHQRVSRAGRSRDRAAAGRGPGVRDREHAVAGQRGRQGAAAVGARGAPCVRHRCRAQSRDGVVERAGRV